MAGWTYVDDSIPEAQAFAAKLSDGAHPIMVTVLDPSEAREKLLSGSMPTSGVLMDVDLSSQSGELGTGPGIAQDIRVRQRSERLSEFPIVRFSGRDKVLRNVRGDPTSSDLFDLKIEKEELTQHLDDVQHRLRGLEVIYASIAGLERENPDLLSLLGVSDEQFEAWGHPSLIERLSSGVHFAVHVAAHALVNTVLTPPGLLINEKLLQFRLGVDAAASGEAWNELRAKFVSFQYAGAGAPFFSAWWAKGLDEWWWENYPSQPLSSLTIEERNKLLEQACKGLRRLEMPQGSAGIRPWRHCSLTLEGASGTWSPVDPSEAVRLTPWSDLPPWVDPQYAALAVAAEEKDPRASREDLLRLSKKHTR